MTNERAIARQAVESAAKIAQRTFLTPQAHQEKAPNQVFTETDLACERAMVAAIHAAFPGDEIVGEEFGTQFAGGPRRWLLDPIDGSRNFMHGIPLFSCGAALAIDDEVVVSALAFPITGEILVASRGEGSWRGEERLASHAPASLGSALVALSRGTGHHEAFAQVITLLNPKVGSLRVLGSMLMGVGKVGTGQFDAAIGANHNPWDIAPGLLIATEAGATALTFHGAPWTITDSSVIIAHPTLAGQLVTALRRTS